MSTNAAPDVPDLASSSAEDNSARLHQTGKTSPFLRGSYREHPPRLAYHLTVPVGVQSSVLRRLPCPPESEFL